MNEKQTKTEEILDDMGLKTTKEMPEYAKDSFDSWSEGIEDIGDRGFLVVKNGLEYKIALTTTKKPKSVKQKSKAFPKDKRRKYVIKGVTLFKVKIADEKEIKKEIETDSNQQAIYDRIYQMQLDITYTLKLTDQQYKSLVYFLKANKIGINKPFYFRRFGKTMGTHFRFYKDSQVKIVTQSKLKK